ncbi:MAG: hypothetical protein M1834_008842 [Cirrosporium novae-zelandiae]|nr:MAG: hypothetical protein M1834_008842 [Cirrosporium novae-zelandiae]
MANSFPFDNDDHPPWAEALLLKMETQNCLLSSQIQELQELRHAVGQMDSKARELDIRKTKYKKYKRQWREEVLTMRATDDERLSKYLAWSRAMPIEHILAPERTWNAWSYRASYPHLASLLPKASLTECSRSQVLCEDFDLNGQVARWGSGKKLLDPAALWETIGTRGLRPANSEGEHLSRPVLVSRILLITDPSPVVISLLLGSTPRVDLAYASPFVERYLAFSNWAKSNLIAIRRKEVNAYKFEYHFAFYFVPKTAMDRELAMKDFRSIRRSAPFSPGSSNPCRFIYEEQLSFLLVGHGSDVFTCYQLAEKYFVGPYIPDSASGSLFLNPEPRHLHEWTPSAIFLSWILRSLHHVMWRWQNAIDAVDAQVNSPSEVIFSDDNPDLLSDDPQFSRSKTYFWALQAYKMFEGTLESTIETWEVYRHDSLPKLNDDRMDPENFDALVKSIDDAVEKLRTKLFWLRKKSEEVRNLRDGLFGASSLFDSRTSVRQGSNIRLLTYITLLFLPLSFCTSIFGMQTILPTTLTIKAFIISLPSITVFTGLLIFNLEYLISQLDIIFQAVTERMRAHMRVSRADWSKVAQALDHDKAANQIPIKRRKKESSHWAYFGFLVEAAFVFIPVSEIKRSTRILRRIFRIRFAANPLFEGPDHQKDEYIQSRAKRIQKVKEKVAEREASRTAHEGQPLGALSSGVRKTGKLISNFCRILLLSIWIPLIMGEYIALLFYFGLIPPGSWALEIANAETVHMLHSCEQQLSDAESQSPSTKNTQNWNRHVHVPTFFKLPLVWLRFLPRGRKPQPTPHIQQARPVITGMKWPVSVPRAPQVSPSSFSPSLSTPHICIPEIKIDSPSEVDISLARERSAETNPVSENSGDAQSFTTDNMWLRADSWDGCPIKPMSKKLRKATRHHASGLNPNFDHNSTDS